jgi:prepilin-type N-terminal cleavage/methylation domain-containing protein
MTPDRSRSGFTLIEIMVVVGVIAVIATIATLQTADWRRNLEVKGITREAADALQLARSEAIRTGRNHIVFFASPGDTDPAGTPIVGEHGTWVPIAIVDDGPPTTANCQIDGGEFKHGLEPGNVQDVDWGVAHATTRAPGDFGKAAFSPPQASGRTFADPSDTAVNWVLFRPDGVPVSFAFSGGTCGQIAGTGSGGGALYVTNGERDYAVVLSPLGGVRVHAWNAGGWSS